MNHHTDEVSPCPLCQDKISMAHPEMKKAWELIEGQFPDCHISWSFRGEKDQNDFFKQKKTRCPWPKSKHNSMQDGKPNSRALDLFKLSVNGDAVFPPRYYSDISNFIEENDLPIQWAGKWKGSFCETDHFQLSENIL